MRDGYLRTGTLRVPGRLRFAVAFAAVGLAWVARAWLLPDAGDRSPFLVFGLAVLVSAIAGGMGPGLLAVGLSSIVAVYLYLPPHHVLAVHEPFDRALLSLFVLEALVAAIAGGLLRRHLSRHTELDHSTSELEGLLRRVEIVRGQPLVIGDRPVEHLTQREREVARLLACGLSNDEIAAALYVSRNTVKTHLKHIYGKLEVRTRTEAVARCVGLGLLDGEPGRDEARLARVVERRSRRRGPELPAA